MTIPQHPHYDWTVSLQAGGRLLPLGQRLSLDGGHFIALFKHQIKVYYLATRQCVRTIPIDLSDVTVVDSLILQGRPNLLYIFDKTGKVIVVNWKEKLAENVVSQFVLAAFEETSFLRIVSFDADNGRALAICGKYSTSTLSPRVVHVCYATTEAAEHLLTVKNIVMYKTSSSRTSAVFLNNSSEVVLVQFKDNAIETTATIAFAFKSKITALAVSNDAETIALGTSSGIVQLIYGKNLDKPQRLLKWHIDQVKALEFNHDDTYLLSGGVEKVLVFWQLDTDRQQFLPRLNGAIERVAVDPNTPELYCVTLGLNDTNDIEFLVLSASDLVSRLTVDDARPNFNGNNSLNRAKKKLGSTVGEFKADFTCAAAVNPLTNHLYLPKGSSIQVYDIKRDEQLFVQTAVATSQTGKVKSEQQILDPKIELLEFSQDGRWMCTFDSVPTPQLDNLLSTKDVHYSLKFWKYVEGAKDARQSYWELSTKIIDPHGVKTPIVSVRPAPRAYHDGLAFVTADTKGGIRLWRPRVPKEFAARMAGAGSEKAQQTAWILKKSFVGNGNFETNSVSLSWSEDASVIVVGYENSMHLVDCNTFREVDEFHLPSLLGSRVRAVHLVDNNVVALAKNRIISYDLLNAKNNELCGRLQTPTNGRHLIAVHAGKGLIALVVNYFDGSDVRAKIFIFKPQELRPVFVGDHHQYVSSVVFAPGLDSFVFVDLDSRIGLVSSTVQEDHATADDAASYAYQLNVLLNGVYENVAARGGSGRGSSGRGSSANGSANGTAPGALRTLADADLADEALTVHGHTLNAHSFDHILEHTDGVQLESLFDRIINIL